MQFSFAYIAREINLKGDIVKYKRIKNAERFPFENTNVTFMASVIRLVDGYFNANAIRDSTYEKNF